MKIQNYGDWKGDKPGGHHPPACTCYRCNKERRQGEQEAAKEEAQRVVGQGPVGRTERPQPSPTQPSPNNRARPARQSSPSPQTSSQRRAKEAVRRSRAGVRPAVQSRPPSPPPRRPRRQKTILFRLPRAVMASALRYALALHAAAVLGLVAYALILGGASSVLPTLDSASEAYVNAWRTVGTVVNLG